MNNFSFSNFIKMKDNKLKKISISYCQKQKNKQDVLNKQKKSTHKQNRHFIRQAIKLDTDNYVCNLKIQNGVRKHNMLVI